jgi:phage-related protein
MARNVTIKFLGDDRDLNKTTSHASDDLDRFSKRAGAVGGVVAGVTTAALNALGSAARGVTHFMGSAITEAEDAARVSRVTAAVLTSTGNAAKVSAKHVSNLSETLGENAGVDDELVQAGANVMLTFKNVRNEAGKGNKIFDRSQKAALDLSAVLGSDLKGANIQLGKALNDPIKGVTALGRAGVQFTADQKKLIKSLVEGGDILGAQKIILGEVESQVGGAAEANATASQRMAVAWDNFKESIGTAILPAVEAITDWLIKTALPAIESFTDRAIAAFGRWGRQVGDAVQPVIDALRPIAVDAWAQVLDLLDRIGQWARDNSDALTVGAAALGAFATSLALVGGVQKAASGVQSLASAFSSLLPALATNPYTLAAAAIVAIGVGAYVAYKKFKPFRDVVDGIVDVFQNAWPGIAATAVEVWHTITDAITTAINTVRPIVEAVVGFLVSVWQRYGDEVTGILVAVAELFAAVWDRIMQVARIVAAVLAPVFDIIAASWQAALIIISTAVQVFVAFVQQIWALWGDELMRVVQTVWSLIANTIEGVLRVIQGVIQVVTGIISGDWGKAWDGVVNIFSGAWQQIKAIAQTVLAFFGIAWTALTSLITAPFDAAKKGIGAIMDGLAKLTENAFNAVIKVLKGALNDIIDVFNAAIRGYNSIPLAPDIPQIPNVRGAGAPTGGTAGVRSLAAFTTPSLMGTRALTPAAVAAPVATRPIVINMPEGASGHNVINAVRRYEQRNGNTGAGWRR